MNILNPRQNIMFFNNPRKARDDKSIFTESITFIRIINESKTAKIKFFEILILVKILF